MCRHRASLQNTTTSATSTECPLRVARGAFEHLLLQTLGHVAAREEALDELAPLEDVAALGVERLQGCGDNVQCS